jgi:serine/threonine protein kinase
VSHGSLHDCLRPPHPPLTVLQRLQILRGVAFGLLALHLSDIIHMDIKPANILLDMHGADVTAKLADFGISRSLDPASTFAGTMGTSCGGSLMWMAPELIQRPPAPSPASDVYAFGMVMYEMFAGCQPWDAELQANGVSPVMIPAWVVAGSRPSIPSHVPQPVASVMEQCWRARPSERPTASDVIDAILQLTEHGLAAQASDSLLPLHGGLVISTCPPALASSAADASAPAVAVEAELQGLVDEMMQLKIGLKKACVDAARLLACEGVMSLGELRALPAAKARALLEKSGMKEMQIDKVAGAYFSSAPSPPPHATISHLSSPPPSVYVTVFDLDTRFFPSPCAAFQQNPASKH